MHHLQQEPERGSAALWAERGARWGPASMAICGQETLTQSGPRRKIVITLRCRSWGCEGCNAKRHKQLAAEALAGNPTTFITLTSRRAEGVYAADAARDLVKAWRRFRRLETIRRRWKDIPFLAVFESTRNGWPHLHILARCGWIDQKRLSDFMRAEINSPIVHIRKIDAAKRAIAYVTKYIGKAPGKFGTLKRYWQTRSYDQRPTYTSSKASEPSYPWERSRQCIITIAEHLYEAGWTLTWQEPDKLIAEDPP